jgi:hypothetical protein
VVDGTVPQRRVEQVDGFFCVGHDLRATTFRRYHPADPVRDCATVHNQPKAGRRTVERGWLRPWPASGGSQLRVRDIGEYRAMNSVRDIASPGRSSASGWLSLVAEPAFCNNQRSG